MMKYLAVFGCVFLALSSLAQSIFQPVFPLKGNTLVTSGFGEMRPNHFHSGIDFGTNGQNLPVVSADNGYIARIKVSPGGYGNVLYINHPSGFTTVYAHLSAFNPDVEQEVFRQQILQRNFSIDFFPDSTRFPVKKGQQIAISGNSGSSTGPHLHFEVRDSKTEEALNPFLHGIQVKDATAPTINSIYAFPLKNKGSVNGLAKMQRLPDLINKPNQMRTFKNEQALPICSGWLSFGIQGGDVIGKPTSSTAIYSIEVFVDEKQIFSSSFNRFSFDDNKAVNGWMHYPTYKASKTKIQQFAVPAFAEPQGIYKAYSNKGYFYFNEDKIYNLQIVCTDFSGNQTTFKGKLKGKPFQTEKIAGNSNLPVFLPGNEKTIRQSNVEVHFPANALFDTTEIQLRTLSSNPFGPSIVLGSSNIPIFHPFQISIQPNKSFIKWADKLFISQKSNGSGTHLKTTWNGEFLKASSSSFGEFELKLDTIAPEINLVLSAGQKQKGGNSSIIPFEKILKFNIQEKQSSIKQMDAFVNDEWMLLKPIKQGPNYTLELPKNLDSGNHQLKVKATDFHGNTQLKVYTIRK